MNQTTKLPNESNSSIMARIKSIQVRWTLLGIVFGASFPIVGTIVEIAHRNLPTQWATVGLAQSGDPVLLIVDTAPLIMGLAFYLIGQREARFRQANRLQQEAVQQAHTIQNNLEQHIEERTRQFQRSSQLLRSSAYITRNIGDLQAVPTLLEKAVHWASDLFGFYHVAIYLFDKERRIAFLQAASSDIGKKMIETGFHIESGPKNVAGYISEQNKSITLTGAQDDKLHLISEGRLEPTRSELAIPLTVRGKIIGIMDFQSNESHVFNQDEIEILQSLADQIAISIDNVHLIEDSKAFVNELESVTTVQTKEIWKSYLENRNLAYQYTPSGTKIIDPRQSKVEAKKDMLVPLRLRGQDIGRLTFRGKEADKWTDRERDLAEKVATQVALALDNSRLLEETRQRALQQQTINEISTRLTNRSLDIDTLLQAAARELGSLPEVVEVSVIIGEQNDSGEEA